MQVKCGALSISSLRVKVFVPHVALFMHKYLPMGRNRRIISNIFILSLCITIFNIEEFYQKINYSMLLKIYIPTFKMKYAKS